MNEAALLATFALKGVVKALNQGYMFHAFRSGGGLRVVRIEGHKKGKRDHSSKLKGYGEHPHIEVALEHAGTDFLAGQRKYDKVYGKMHPHFMTGSSDPTSELDKIILSGESFDFWKTSNKVNFRINAWNELTYPENLSDICHSRGAIRWRDYRGHLYESEPFLFANGEKSASTRFVEADACIFPETSGDHPNDPFLWREDFIGAGATISDAYLKAFEAYSEKRISSFV